MKNQKVIWSDGVNVYVVSKSNTSNAKIAPDKKTKLIQTYTFSIEQYELATTQKGFGMKKFFALDGSNCLDCPFSGNGGNGGCYTHKFNQYVGFLSMLRSIKPLDLTPLDETKYRSILDMSHETYVRFGTYGEPSLLPIELVKSMALLSSSYTGYTHQYQKEWANEFSAVFMASTHTQTEADKAREIGFRSFIATETGDENAVSCPASKEAGFVTNCAKCGLCSGTDGKGSKDVKILIH